MKMAKSLEAVCIYIYIKIILKNKQGKNLPLFVIGKDRLLFR